MLSMCYYDDNWHSFADGFRKLSNNCSNGMKKIDHRTISPEVAHFYHVNFMRDNERKIADIKRKVSN